MYGEFYSLFLFKLIISGYGMPAMGMPGTYGQPNSGRNVGSINPFGSYNLPPRQSQYGAGTAPSNPQITGNPYMGYRVSGPSMGPQGTGRSTGRSVTAPVHG